VAKFSQIVMLQARLYADGECASCRQKVYVSSKTLIQFLTGSAIKRRLTRFLVAVKRTVYWP